MKGTLDPRHRSRVTALQALFEWSFNSTDITQLVKRDVRDYLSLESVGESKLSVDEDMAVFLSKGVTDNLDTIDQIIESSAPDWPLSQVAKVDLEILRIAIF